MERRSFNKLIIATGITASVQKGWPKSLLVSQSVPALPAVVDNNRSVELCLNSRYSFHGGYTTTANNQIIANTLWAAAAAPLIATERIIYVALSDNLYRYRFQDGNHVLEKHLAGDKRTEKSATAFEIGVATTPADALEDAGAALHWAHLATIAFWGSKSNQPGCCPKDSATDDANSSWNPASSIHLVNCYGQMAAVNGTTAELVAASSDKSLPDPTTDGTMSLEKTIKNPLFGASFLSDNLTLDQLSQILWASYGCTPHKIGAAAGISVASWNYKYFMTGKIYLAIADGIKRYHIRTSSSAVSSRDHRIVDFSADDCRTELRSALSRLPQQAPAYFIFCGSKVERPQRIEAGYCGSSALLQTTALGLQGHYCAQFTATEQSAIQQACGIPAADIPMLIFSAGKPSDTHVEFDRRIGLNRSTGLSAHPNPFSHATVLSFSIGARYGVAVRIFDMKGQLVRKLTSGKTAKGLASINWDGCDDRGRTVAPGMYTCMLDMHGHKESIQIRKQ